VELGVILHISKRTIAGYLAEGILPHSRVGAKIWVTEAQLQQFLEAHSNTIIRGRELKGQRGGSNHE